MCIRDSPWVKRVFNDNFDKGGRFYGGFQNLPKLERSKILIDGMPTLEPDFSGLHFNLLYAQKGLQFDGDVYDVVGYSRETIKAVMLPLMNNENLNAVKGNIKRSGNPTAKRAYETYKRELKEHENLRARGIKSREPKRGYNGFIDGIPDNTDGEHLINAILQKHEPIADMFGTKDLGVKLQNKDSEIMANVITELSKRYVAVLPVHDSVICKVSDYSLVVDTMRQEYEKSTGFKIIVK